MSGRVSRQEFASLADELEDLRQQLAVLRVDKEQLESRVAELEDEAAQRSYSVISECSSAVPVLPIQEDLPADRIEIAHRIGAWLRRCLDGRARGLSGRESLKQASSLYLVARDIKGNLFDPPKVCDSWAGTKPLVSNKGHLGESVFIGLPTKAESKIVVTAAGLRMPTALSQ